MFKKILLDSWIFDRNQLYLPNFKKNMYRQKIQDLQFEIIGLISLKVGFILKDKHSKVNLLSSFRINNSTDSYDVVNSLGISGDKVCFITDDGRYLDLGETGIFDLAWVLDQFISQNFRTEGN